MSPKNFDDHILDGAYDPLPAGTEAAAAAFIRRRCTHGLEDVLAALGLGAA